MAPNSRQKTGLIVVVASLVIGMVGTVWNINGSFEALETAEKFGIAGVVDSIRNALFFSAGGVVGAVAGALLMIMGRSKSA